MDDDAKATVTEFRDAANMSAKELANGWTRMNRKKWDKKTTAASRPGIKWATPLWSC